MSRRPRWITVTYSEKAHARARRERERRAAALNARRKPIKLDRHAVTDNKTDNVTINTEVQL